ncbi:hypothetical protein [Acidiferrimicrobium sp. IK]|uniref:hypothetical protein n=1 Tax=Acidiferrimicrobium sp. IK TaxID=2871700 RepID=UPI0021CB0DB1|nr:hypothetical protein [Acidiferrimicrobium sp. IK]
MKSAFTPCCAKKPFWSAMTQMLLLVFPGKIPILTVVGDGPAPAAAGPALDGVALDGVAEGALLPLEQPASSAPTSTVATAPWIFLT